MELPSFRRDFELINVPQAQIDNRKVSRLWTILCHSALTQHRATSPLCSLQVEQSARFSQHQPQTILVANGPSSSTYGSSALVVLCRCSPTTHSCLVVDSSVA